MPSKSKSKGNNWENTVSKHLSSLYSASFMRVPGSGAYIGGKNAVRKDFLHEGQIRSMKGDIVPPLNWKHFNAECKSYADFPFHQLFTAGEIKILDTWIEQTLEVADTDDFNIIMMKFNRKGSYVAFEHKHFKKFKLQKSVDYYSKKNGKWVFTDYDSFWNANHEVVKTLCLAK